MKPQQNIYRIIESFEYHAEDIDNVFNKEWLKAAIISNVAMDTGINDNFVMRVIDLIYVSADL